MMDGLAVLLVEDDPVVRKLETETLERWGFSVTALDSFSDVDGAFAAADPQLVVMDVDLPSFDGYEWCSRIRAVSRVPILFVSGLSAPGDAVRALAGGADDWITKPFDAELLAARARALVRRAYSWAAESSRVLARSGLVFDVERRVVSKDGRRTELGKNEARILERLLSKDGATATRMELMDALWSEDSFVDDNTLTVNVTRLKKKLAEIGAEHAVKTTKGEGYRIP
jgi:DNA-binding response OmpR family regulator